MAKAKKSGRHPSDPDGGQRSPRSVKVPSGPYAGPAKETARGVVAQGVLNVPRKEVGVPQKTPNQDPDPVLESVNGCSCRRPQEQLVSGIDEAPNQDSERGLDRPQTVPYTVEQIEAHARHDIGKITVWFFGVIMVIGLCATIAATFAGVPTAPLSSYLQTLMTAVTPLVTLMLGYYFGAQRQRTREKQD